VNKQALDKTEVKEFVDFYLKNASKLTAQVKYVPLPASAYKLATERLVKKKTGSMFGGKESVGMKIEELMKLEEKKK
jgi:phosphate transport system substrate-binding protein